MLDDYVTGTHGEIPWVAAAEFYARVTRPAVPEARMTKQATLGLLKLAALNKKCEDALPPQVAALQAQAMTDPDVVAALDWQEAQAERQALQGTVQTLEYQVSDLQQQQQQVVQQAQQQAAVNQQLQAQVQQAVTDRQAATEQALAARDSALQEQVVAQQNRQQLMAAADQLALQLKQVAAQPTAAEQTAMAGAQPSPDAVAPPEAQGVPLSARAAQETQQAQKAQEQAQIQAQQAAQAQAEDQAKMGSDRVAELRRRLALAKTAGVASWAVPLVAGTGAGAALGAGGAAMAAPEGRRAAAAKRGALVGAGLGLASGGLHGAAKHTQRAADLQVARMLDEEKQLKNFIEFAPRGLSLHKLDIHELHPHRLSFLDEETVSGMRNRIAVRDAAARRVVGLGLASTAVGLTALPAGVGVGLHDRYRAAQEKTAGGKLTAGMALGGAALGAGYGGVSAIRQGRQGRDKPNDRELDLANRIQVAKAKAERSPSYRADVRIARMQFLKDVAESDRKHPGGEVLHNAVSGALAGALTAVVAGAARNKWREMANFNSKAVIDRALQQVRKAQP